MWQAYIIWEPRGGGGGAASWGRERQGGKSHRLLPTCVRLRRNCKSITRNRKDCTAPALHPCRAAQFARNSPVATSALVYYRDFGDFASFEESKFTRRKDSDDKEISVPADGKLVAGESRFRICSQPLVRLSAARCPMGSRVRPTRAICIPLTPPLSLWILRSSGLAASARPRQQLPDASFKRARAREPRLMAAPACRRVYFRIAGRMTPSPLLPFPSLYSRRVHPFPIYSTVI